MHKPLEFISTVDTEPMLNISKNTVSDRIDSSQYKSLHMSQTSREMRLFSYWLYGLIAILIIFMFLPWTQVVNGRGQVTALYPQQRPQTIQSPIPGRIERWLIAEGDTVSAGDTLLVLSEVKDEYFDPNILQRLQQELTAKESSVVAYADKAIALRNQIGFLRDNLKVKLIQTKQKIQADSNAFAAADIQKQLAEIQFKRADTLFKDGVVSRFDVEKRRQYLQESLAKAIDTRNKYRNSLSDLEAITAEYQEKIAKAESDLYSAESAGLTAQADVAKLRVKQANVQVRQDNYYLKAPQNGMITRINFTGVGENIKEGDPVLEIMPLVYQLAVELFVRPVDLPLLKKNQHARIEFDGWPAIVFTGWPNVSFGTFGAKVFAIDNVLDKNGRYRILLEKDDADLPWPEPLRFGAGANGMLLLNDVPIWYEIWRQFNGFPPDFYTGQDEKDEKVKKKPKAGYSK